MIFQPKNCLAVAYSIHFQPLVTQQFLTFNKFMLHAFALIRGKSDVLSPFLSRFVVFQKTTVAEILKKVIFLNDFLDFCHLVG